MPYHEGKGTTACIHCNKPMSQWKAGDECPMTQEAVTVAICGPSTGICKCRCPDSCEHKWDGPSVELAGGRGGSISCSRCGMLAIDHDLWVMP